MGQGIQCCMEALAVTACIGPQGGRQRNRRGKICRRFSIKVAEQGEVTSIRERARLRLDRWGRIQDSREYGNGGLW